MNRHDMTFSLRVHVILIVQRTGKEKKKNPIVETK
jgi:hypothetical protein